MQNKTRPVAAHCTLHKTDIDRLMQHCLLGWHDARQNNDPCLQDFYAGAIAYLDLLALAEANGEEAPSIRTTH